MVVVVGLSSSVDGVDGDGDGSGACAACIDGTTMIVMPDVEVVGFTGHCQQSLMQFLLFRPLKCTFHPPPIRSSVAVNLVVSHLFCLPFLHVSSTLKPNASFIAYWSSALEPHSYHSIPSAVATCLTCSFKLDVSGESTDFSMTTYRSCCISSLS